MSIPQNRGYKLTASYNLPRDDASEEGLKAWDRLLAEAANVLFSYAFANNQATSYSQVIRTVKCLR
jgi:hypothetical protein